MGFGIFREARERRWVPSSMHQAIAKLPEVYEFLLGEMDEIVAELLMSLNAVRCDWQPMTVYNV